MICAVAKLMSLLCLYTYASEDALSSASCDGEEQDATVALQLRGGLETEEVQADDTEEEEEEMQADETDEMQ